MVPVVIASISECPDKSSTCEAAIQAGIIVSFIIKLAM